MGGQVTLMAFSAVNPLEDEDAHSRCQLTHVHVDLSSRRALVMLALLLARIRDRRRLRPRTSCKRSRSPCRRTSSSSILQSVLGRRTARARRPIRSSNAGDGAAEGRRATSIRKDDQNETDGRILRQSRRGSGTACRRHRADRPDARSKRYAATLTGAALQTSRQQSQRHRRRGSSATASRAQRLERPANAPTI